MMPKLIVKEIWQAKNCGLPFVEKDNSKVAYDYNNGDNIEDGIVHKGLPFRFYRPQIDDKRQYSCKNIERQKSFNARGQDLGGVAEMMALSPLVRIARESVLQESALSGALQRYAMPQPKDNPAQMKFESLIDPVAERRGVFNV